MWTSAGTTLSRAARAAAVPAAAAPIASPSLGAPAVGSSSRAAAGKRRIASITPPKQAPSPLLLVFDIDETLVRVRCEGVHANRKTLEQEDFRISVDLARPPKSNLFECAVEKRPGLDSFLEWLQERRASGAIAAPWLFTTSSGKYTKPLLKRIDPGGRIFGMRVLEQKACSPAALPGYLLKDLNRVQPGDGSELRRKLLVDNNPVSHVLNPGGAILLRDWLGNDPHDTELSRVQALIDRVLACPEGGDTGDYVGALARATPGRGGQLRERLTELEGRLLGSAPTDLGELRGALKAVSAECHSIKKDVLGAAP